MHPGFNGRVQRTNGARDKVQAICDSSLRVDPLLAAPKRGVGTGPTHYGAGEAVEIESLLAPGGEARGTRFGGLVFRRGRRRGEGGVWEEARSSGGATVGEAEKGGIGRGGGSAGVLYEPCERGGGGGEKDEFQKGGKSEGCCS